MEYFAHLGYPCPSHCNPADHLIDLVSTDYDSTVTAARDSARIEGLVGAWTRHTATTAAALMGKRPAGAIRGNQIQSEAITLRGKRHAPSAAAATTATATAAARAAPLPRHPTTPRSRPPDPRSRPPAPLRQTRRCSGRRSPLVRFGLLVRRSWCHLMTPNCLPHQVRFGLLVRRSWCQNVRWPLTGRTTMTTECPL